MNHIAPSLCCGDLLNLGEQIGMLDRLGVGWFHFDIMDGRFVPNFALGTDQLRAVKQKAAAPVYVHMMATDPQNHIKRLAELGADYLAFHFEASNTPFRIVAQIKNAGMKAAVAINPITPVEVLEPLLPDLDCITLMTIEPGFPGPRFMEFSYKRIAALKERILKRNAKTLIEIDGGIGPDNAKQCLENGADLLVCGIYALFTEKVPLEEAYLRFSSSLV